MCGRFVLRSFPDSFARSLRVYDVGRLNPADPPRYNIAPSQPITVVCKGNGDERALIPMIWGLIPHWSKERPSRGGWINARAETVFDKPSFRSAAKYRRCLIPTDGFYEWRTTRGKKVPYLFERPDGSPFCFAGIWDHWTAPDGSEVQTAAILTTGPTAAVEGIHDRSPVILDEPAWDVWTDTPPEESRALGRILRPASDDFLTSRVVSTLVNNVRNDTPECVLSPD